MAGPSGAWSGIPAGLLNPCLAGDYPKDTRNSSPVSPRRWRRRPLPCTPADRSQGRQRGRRFDETRGGRGALTPPFLRSAIGFDRLCSVEGWWSDPCPTSGMDSRTGLRVLVIHATRHQSALASQVVDVDLSESTVWMFYSCRVHRRSKDPEKFERFLQTGRGAEIIGTFLGQPRRDLCPQAFNFALLDGLRRSSVPDFAKEPRPAPAKPPAHLVGG